MSDAKVTFLALDHDDDQPGHEQIFSFACPRKNRQCTGLVIKGKTNFPHDPQGKNGGIAQWEWDGNREAPTFKPSINCGGCGWHGFVENGRCVNVAHQDEPERA